MNSKLTTTIDITSVYNENYYKLVFPNFQTSTIHDVVVTSLPQLLGFQQNEYLPNCLFSNSTLNPTNLPDKKITLTLKNNYITILLYQGVLSETHLTSYNPITTTTTTSNTILNTITIVSSLVPGIYSCQDIISNFQTVLQQNTFLNTTRSSFFYNTDLNKYQLTIIVDRTKVINGINIKCALSFAIDIDHPLWTGTDSLFQFSTVSWNDINNIISDAPSKITLYSLPSSPRIKFECKNQNYNISLNNREFIIPNQFSPYTLSGYIDTINLGLQTSINDPFQCVINNTLSVPTIQCQIKNNIPFYTGLDPNFRLITKNSVLESIFGFSEISTQITTIDNFTIRKMGYFLENNANIFQLKCIGTRNSNIEPISITIPKPTNGNSYAYLEDFIEAINQSFVNATLANENATNIDFTGTKLVLGAYDKIKETISCTLTLNVKIILTEKDYKISFTDPYGYDGTSSTNNVWENEKNSWYSFLHFSQPSYDLQLSSIIKGSQTVYSNQILLTKDNNTFSFDAIENEMGGVYVKGSTIYNVIIVLTLQTGFYYTKEEIVTNINGLLFQNKISSGSYIDILTDKKTIFRINLNKIFTAQDYRIVFFDKTFTQCKFGYTSSVENVKWDTTLGWILGYRNLTEYDLSIKNVNGNEINTSFYRNFPSQAFQVNSLTNVVKLTGDTSINVNLYNYALIVLDDYCQNHLNDGLLTITKSDQTIALPSYASRIATICDNKSNVSMESQFSNLTANQLYSANQLLQSKIQKQNRDVRTASSFIQDIFAFIPIKTSGLSRGQSFVDSSGSLQNQERTYVGPVNIRRLTVRLLSDKGSILNLNGVNWCFTFLAEQLFKAEK